MMRRLVRLVLLMLLAIPVMAQTQHGRVVSSGVNPRATGDDLGSPSLRWDLFGINFDITGYQDVLCISTPANPTGGTRRIFCDTATGELSVRTSGGSTISLEGAGGGGGVDRWDQLLDPTGNLTIDMDAFTTDFGWSLNTGASNLITFHDFTSNTGTGYVVAVNTASGSTARVISLTALGTTNGVEVNASGVLQILGTGSIVATDLQATSEVVSDPEVEDTITVTNYLLLAGGTLTGQLVTDNLGIEFTESDTNPTCAGVGDFSIYADDSENVIKKCQDGVLTDLDTAGAVAGANEEVQFNDSGTQAGDPGLKFNKTTDTVTTGSVVTTGSSAHIVFPDSNEGVSATDTAKLIFDKDLVKLRVSLSGAAYTDVGGGGGGDSTQTERFEITECAPDTSTDPGNSFWTVSPFTAWDAPHWEFVLNVDGAVFCTITIPDSVAATPAAAIVFAISADATSGDTRFIVSSFPPADGESMNPSALTAEAAQNITVPATARFRKDAIFTLTNAPVAGDILIVKIFHNGINAADTLGVNTEVWKIWLRIDVTN